MKFKSFKTRITITFVSHFLVAILALAVASTYFAANVIRREAQNHLYTAAESRAGHIDTYLQQNIERLKLITSRTKLRATLAAYNEDPQEQYLVDMTNIIRDAQTSVTEIERICVVDLTGTVIASTNEDFCGKDISSKDFYTGGLLEEHVYYVLEDGTYKMFVTGPFKDGDKILGVGITVLSLDSLREIVHKRTGLGETGEVLIGFMGSENSPVFPLERLFEEVAAEEVSSEATAGPMKAALQGKEQFFPSGTDYRNEEVYAVSQYIESGKLGLVAKIDKADALGDLYMLIAVYGVVALTISILIGLRLRAAAENIVQPLSSLQEGVARISEGDLNYTIRSSSDDEIGALVKAFNGMAQKLKVFKEDMEGQVQKRTAQLQEFNSKMVGRELKMAELKKELEKLRGE